MRFKSLLVAVALLFTMTVSLHAVTVTWDVQLASGETWGTGNFTYSFVFSAGANSDAADIGVTGALDVALGRYAGTETTSIVLNATTAGGSTFLEQPSDSGAHVEVTVPDDGTEALTPGYYYVVIFRVDTDEGFDATTLGASDYIVAGSYFDGSYNETSTSAGFGETEAGSIPTGDYVDLTAMSTWAPAPEPTVLALLALGIAGVTLRRRF